MPVTRYFWSAEISSTKILAWSMQVLIAKGTTDFDIFNSTIFSSIPTTSTSFMFALRVYGTPQLSVKNERWTLYSPEGFLSYTFTVLSAHAVYSSLLQGLNRTQFILSKFGQLRVRVSVSKLNTFRLSVSREMTARSVPDLDTAITVISSPNAKSVETPPPICVQVKISNLQYSGTPVLNPPTTILVFESQKRIQLPVPPPGYAIDPTDAQVDGSQTVIGPLQTITKIRLSVGCKLTWVTSSAIVRVWMTFRLSIDHILTVLSLEPVTSRELSLQMLTVTVISEWASMVDHFRMLVRSIRCDGVNRLIKTRSVTVYLFIYNQQYNAVCAAQRIILRIRSAESQHRPQESFCLSYDLCLRLGGSRILRRSQLSEGFIILTML